MPTPAPAPAPPRPACNAPPLLNELDIDDCPEFIRRPGTELSAKRRGRRPAYHAPPRAHHRGRGR